MAIPDAQTVADRWAQGAGAAQGRYTDGVTNTQKDPTALAIQAGQRYITSVQQAFTSGKWANGLRRVGAAGWKSATVARAGNYGTGVAQSRDKFADRIAPVLQYETALQGQINSMPNVTDADRKARMNAWFDGMSRYGQ